MKKNIQGKNTHWSWTNFLIHIVSPAVLTIGLCNVAIFLIILPAMENALIERKKDTIRELTQVVFSELSELHRQEKEKLISLEVAQKQALEQIESLRYGRQNKDYFWVTDFQPKMILHPYRKDLNGKDVTHYADAGGKELFSEFVLIAKTKGEGFLDYLWQWNDDSSRIAPKLSFVKSFQPWGWIIGTGIYLDDVQNEISQVTRQIIQITLTISVFIAGLLAYIARHTLRLEFRRRQAEHALLLSEEKYRLLVESTNEAVVLTVEGQIVFANKQLLQILDVPEIAVKRMAMDQVLNQSATKNCVLGSVTDVLFEGKQAKIYSLKFKSDSFENDNQQSLSQLLSELQNSLLMPNTTVSHFAKPIVECELHTPIKKAVRAMSEAKARSIFVKVQGSGPIGIVTDRDLRERVLLQKMDNKTDKNLDRNIDLDKPVSSIMTSPVCKISQNALLFEATLIFQDKGIHQLGVMDDKENLIGVLSIDDVLQTQRHPASIILKEIKEAKIPADVFRSRKNLPSLVKALLDNNAKVEGVAKTLSAISDAITVKFVEFAIEQLTEQFGPPPVSFSFVAFGSEARSEQTLVTDQDNGIVYENPPEGSRESVHSYFVKLGRLVCDWMHEAGYKYCAGDIMAKNSKWCQPIDKWLEYFTDRVSNSTPKDLFELNVFFDFRSVYGDDSFISMLRQHLGRLIENRSVFFYQLTLGALEYKPPLNFFGKIEVSDEQAGAFNIKNALTPIVNFARIYALKYAITEVNTLARLEQLLKKEVIKKSSFDELLQAHSFLNQMRLSHQADQIQRSIKPDNFILIDELTQIEKSLLTKIFSNILVFQARLSSDFVKLS